MCRVYSFSDLPATLADAVESSIADDSSELDTMLADMALDAPRFSSADEFERWLVGYSRDEECSPA